MVFQLDEEWTSKTVKAKVNSRKVAWNSINDIETPITGDLAKYKKLEILVKCNNELGKEITISKASISLVKAGAQLGKPVCSKLKLKDTKRGRSAGKLEVVHVIEEVIIDRRV